MRIDKRLIEHVASLARLRLGNNEIDKFLPQLREILEVFSKLDEVNTDNVEASFQPVRLGCVMRKDEAEECLSQEEALSLTEHKRDGYFKGPRVV
jgi:aspartyl-tRNA(Asn)/glutamyl-tRNA(Gln) amidotransferase subunit C